MAFDILDQWFIWTNGPMDPWTNWSIEPMVHWSIGPLVHWSIGPLDHWYIGPLVHWTIGTLVFWTIRPLDHWSIGPLDHLTIGPLVDCKMSKVNKVIFLSGRNIRGKESCALISPVNNIPILVFSGSSQHTPDTQHATNGGGQGGPDDQFE